MGAAGRGQGGWDPSDEHGFGLGRHGSGALAADDQGLAAVLDAFLKSATWRILVVRSGLRRLLAWGQEREVDVLTIVGLRRVGGAEGELLTTVRAFVGFSHRPRRLDPTTVCTRYTGRDCGVRG